MGSSADLGSQLTEMVHLLNDGSSNSRGEILIVDDSLLDLKLMAELLLAHKFQVHRANSPASALRVLETWLPDVILLDINMPGLSGYELCQQIKNNPKTVDIPVIFISASDDGIDKQTAFRVGGADYIEKPFQVEEMIVRIQNQLKVRQTAEELKQKNRHLEKTLQELRETQTLLIEAERVSTLGQVVKHIASEIKLPMELIGANIQHINQCCENILDLLRLYDKLRQNPDFLFSETKQKNQMDLFKSDVIDIIRLLSLTELETAHIQVVAESINNLFSPDDAELKPVDINHMIEALLLILRGRLKRSRRASIKLVKNLEGLPKLLGYANQLSQALFITLNHALDALDAKNAESNFSEEHEPLIQIETSLLQKDTISIILRHNGLISTKMLETIPQESSMPIMWNLPQSQLDMQQDKPDLGLFVTYQIIVSKHAGQLRHRVTDRGLSEFIMELPIMPYS